MNFFEPESRATPEQIAKIRSWVKECLRLDDEVVVMVSELRCSEPGCPPLETLIAILDGPGQKRQFKFHKRILEITASDIDSAVSHE